MVKTLTSNHENGPDRAVPALLRITNVSPQSGTALVAGGQDEPLEATVEVTLDDLIQTRLLLQADSGGGKSWAIRNILEQTYSAVPQVLIDIEGEFSTLREKFPYLLVSATEGEGEFRADPNTAGTLCRKVAEHGASVIIDLYDLDEPEQQLFVANYAAELLSLPKELWTPRLVVIDEAERMAPEQGAAVSKSMISSLVKRARKRRIGVILAAQNLSDLSKKAARSLHNKMIGLATLDTDIKRSAAELGFDKDRARELSELEAGTFFAHGSAFPYRGVRLLRTGPVQTTHDPLSQRETTLEAMQTPETLNNLLEKLAKIEPPSDSRNTDRGEKTTSPGDENRITREITTKLEAQYSNELKRRLDKTLDQHVAKETKSLSERVEFLETSLENAKRHAKECLSSLEPGNRPRDSAPTPTLEPRHTEPAERTPTEQTEPETKEVPDFDSDIMHSVREPMSEPIGEPVDVQLASGLSENHRRILDQLEFLHQHGVRSIDRQNLALLSGRSPRSSAYDDALSKLKKLELLDYPEPGRVMITGQGTSTVEFVVENGRVTTNKPKRTYRKPEDLHDVWLNYLGAYNAALLKPVILEYPAALTRLEASVRSGKPSSSSAFDDALARMRKIGLIEYPAPGYVRATKLLFPEGLSH